MTSDTGLTLTGENGQAICGFRSDKSISNVRVTSVSGLRHRTGNHAAQFGTHIADSHPLSNRELVDAGPEMIKPDPSNSQRQIRRLKESNPFRIHRKSLPVRTTLTTSGTSTSSLPVAIAAACSVEPTPMPMAP